MEPLFRRGMESQHSAEHSQLHSRSSRKHCSVLVLHLDVMLSDEDIPPLPCTSRQSR